MLKNGPNGVRETAAPFDSASSACIAVALLIAGIYLAAIWAAPIPQFQDNVEWIYQGQLLAWLVQGSELSFEVKPYPVPNAVWQTAIGAMALAMPATVAGQIVSTALLLASLAVAWRVAMRFAPDRAAPAFLILLVILLGSSFLNGYLNYLTGILLILLFVTLPQRVQSRVAVVAGFGTVLFFTHALALGVFGIIVALSVLRGPAPPWLLAGLLPALGLSAWYFRAEHDTKVGADILPDFTPDAASYLAYKIYTVAKHGPYQNIVSDTLSQMQSMPALFWSGVAVNLVFAAMLGLLTLGTAHRYVVGRDRSVPAAAGLICVALFLVFPRNLFPDVVNAGERLLMPGLLLLLVAALKSMSVGLLRALAFMSVVALVPAISLLSHSAQVAPITATERLPIAERGLPHLFAHAPDRFNHRYPALGQPGEAASGTLYFDTSLLRPARPR